MTTPNPHPHGDQPHAAPHLVLSRENVHVGTEWVATGRLRLRRQIVTETVMVPVTVRREILVVDELPPESDRSITAAPSWQQLVIELRVDVPVVDVRPQLYERVTVHRNLITTEHTVTMDCATNRPNYSTTSMTDRSNPGLLAINPAQRCPTNDPPTSRSPA